jgi:hypothetical protein
MRTVSVAELAERLIREGYLDNEADTRRDWLVIVT